MVLGDVEWMPLVPYGWLVRLWCLAIAAQVVAAVLIFVWHRRFVSAWRRCEHGTKAGGSESQPSLRSRENSAHPNEVALNGTVRRRGRGRSRTLVVGLA